MNMEHLWATLAVLMIANLILCMSEEHAHGRADLTCNEIHNGTNEGTIHNPMYPDNDHGTKFCNYQITVPSNNQVALSFPELKFVHSDSAIFLFDGPDCMSRRIGHVWYLKDNPLISSGNSITALLTVQNGAEVWGFKGNYSTGASTLQTAQGDCGGELRGPNGKFSFRKNSSSLVVCVWRITVTPRRKVKLIFNSLTLAAFNPLLRVLDGSTCGGLMLSELSRTSSIPQSGIVSNSNTMTVVYTEAYVGAELTNIDASFSEIITEVTTTTGTGTTPIRTTPTSSTKTTNGDIKADLTCYEIHNGTTEGTIHNPMYPDSDHGSKFCNYQITVPSNNQVALSFPELKFAHSDSAIFLFGGPDCMSRRIGYVWHPDINPLISPGNSITALLTVQNGSEVWRFKANYSTGHCGGELRGPNGNFSFRTNASRLVVCVWRITVTPGRKVKLIFNSLILAAFNPLLRVLDGSTCGGTMLSELSRNSSIPLNGIVSNSNTMMVVYTETTFGTGLTNIDASFSEDIKADLTCNEIHNGTTEGTIHNPMYPDSDHGSKFCNYQITVPSNNQVALSFPELKFAHSDSAIFLFGGPDCMSRRIGYVWHPDINPLISPGNSITALMTVQNGSEVWRFKANYST
ncbi:unnamed protein product, partial [Dicrocoelium dendriticum]